MHIKKVLALTALAPLFLAGSAFAQTSTSTSTSTTTTTSSTTTTTTSTPSTTATSGPALAAEAEFVQRIVPGSTNAVIGIITLDATLSGAPVTVNAVPISVSATGGATLSTLTDCALYTTTGTKLTTGGNAVSAITGANSFRLDTPLNIPAGQGALLVLRCSVASGAPQGGVVTVGVTPSSFQATSSSGAVTVTQGFQSNGLPGTNSQAIMIASTGSTIETPTIPGIPNTGAGGDSLVYLSLLILTALAAFLGFRGVVKQ